MKEGDRVAGDIQLWHPGFHGAMLAELWGYKGLDILREYKLTAESLSIDVLVIKKSDDVIIDKNIARIFRAHNIIEYKSPEDSVSVEDLLKVFAYMFLYASKEKVSLKNITLSFVLTMHPRVLLRYLNDELDVKMDLVEDGIYNGEWIGIPIQIIEWQRLNP